MTTSTITKQRFTHGQIGSIPRHRYPLKPVLTSLPSVPQQMAGRPAEVMFLAVRAAGVLRAFAANDYATVDKKIAHAVVVVSKHQVCLDEVAGDGYARRVAEGIEQSMLHAQDVSDGFTAGVNTGKSELATLERKVARMKADIASFEASRDIELNRLEELWDTAEVWDQKV